LLFSFQGTAASKVQSLQLMAKCIVAKRCLALFQTNHDLRITDHRGHKFQPSLTLLSVENSNRMASRLTAIVYITEFSKPIFQLLQYSRQHASFSAHRAALMTNTDWRTCLIQHIFFKICWFLSSILLSHERRQWRQVWQWRDFPGPITIVYYA